ncbi:aminoglycoside N(3)-acetyltransferase [Microbacterium helvum]|nr:AAC(3) family N-acetyltransferase [Microbacterium helvum]
MSNTRYMKSLADGASDVHYVGVGDIAGGMRAVGVEPGDVILVHCALSSFGTVVGGEQAVVEALRLVVGPMGTIVMPSQSWHLCHPDYLDDPALDGAARARTRELLPAFDPALTPTRTMGRVAELFRTQPGVLRSAHPHRSFAAQGLEAEGIVNEHPVDEPFGERSPLARLYAMGAKVVLLGVGYESCTALHLAESRAGGPERARVRNGAPLLINGQRTWVDWDEPVVDDQHFASIGAKFDDAGGSRSVRIGAAECRVMELARLVDFAQRRL